MRTELGVYLSVMDLELRKAEDTLNWCNRLSTDPMAIVLRTKINNLQWAKLSLVALEG